MKSFLIVLVVFFFCLFSCSKEEGILPVQDNEINPVGLWTVHSLSYKYSDGKTESFNATQYPCLNNNVFYVKQDLTTLMEYTGSDTCYLVNTVYRKIEIGKAGERGTGKWRQEGNKLFTQPDGSSVIYDPWILSKSDGKEYLTFVDTLSAAIFTYTYWR